MLTVSPIMELEGSPVKKVRDGQLDGVGHLPTLPEYILDSIVNRLEDAGNIARALRICRGSIRPSFIGYTRPSLSAPLRFRASEILEDMFSRPGVTHTAESMKHISSEFSYRQYHTGPESDQMIISYRPLLIDAVQLELPETDAILCPNLPDCKIWKDVFTTMSPTFRNPLKEVWSMQSGGPNIVSNGLDFFKSASKLAVGMVLFGNTLAVGAVGAMAPEAAEPGSLQAENFEKSSNFAFGVVACVGTLVAIIALLKSFNWRRRHSIAGTSAASAPAGSILNRAVNVAQTHTVLRSWSETEFREVVVALREEGAYAS